MFCVLDAPLSCWFLSNSSASALNNLISFVWCSGFCLVQVHQRDKYFPVVSFFALKDIENSSWNGSICISFVWISWNTFFFCAMKLVQCWVLSCSCGCLHPPPLDSCPLPPPSSQWFSMTEQPKCFPLNCHVDGVLKSAVSWYCMLSTPAVQVWPKAKQGVTVIYENDLNPGFFWVWSLTVTLKHLPFHPFLLLAKAAFVPELCSLTAWITKHAWSYIMVNLRHSKCRMCRCTRVRSMFNNTEK